MLTREAARECLLRRQGRPWLLIDLGVPRNLDPACRELAGAYHADLDDLASVANANQRAREEEASRARVALADRADRAFAATPAHPA